MTEQGVTSRRPHRQEPAALARELARSVTTGRHLLVALDHDGVLSPIAPRPQDAVLAEGAAAALDALGRVADVVILSGRGLDDLARRVGDLPVRIVAEHGLRQRDRDGRVTPLADMLPPASLDAVRTRLSALLTSERTADGWLVEDKGVGVAVHHRRVAHDRVEPTLSAVRELFRTVPGGHVQEGKAVVELRASGADKGLALARLIAASDGDVPVMVGDDLTDEPAFATAETAGGLGVLVASEERPSAASVRLVDPGEVVTLLAALAALLTPGR